MRAQHAPRTPTYLRPLKNKIKTTTNENTQKKLQCTQFDCSQGVHSKQKNKNKNKNDNA